MAKPPHCAPIPLSISRLDQTVCWLEEVLPAFDPLPSGTPNQVNQKAFAELAIVVLCLTECTTNVTDAPSFLTSLVRLSTEHLKRHCSRPEYIEAARRDPLNAYTYILPYLTLRSLGHRCPAFESLLAWLNELALPLSSEVVPYREMDRLHFMHKSKYLAGPAPLDSIFQNTTLARRRNPIYYSELDAYAVTHTIFYLADFGLRPIALPRHQIEQISTLVQSLLIHFWRIGDWDLMGELLICANYLDIPRTRLLTEASDSFEALVRADGTVPARAKRVSAKNRRTKCPGATIPEVIRTCYHTTFVWILYVLSTLDRPCPMQTNSSSIG